ncbi:MAG: MOSC domain-containing protein [Planctomycetota bacterium]
MRAVIASIQVGKTQQYHNDGKSWESAIAKLPVAGPILVLPEGLDGDQQADRVHHGGPDKAILAYNSGHFSAWQEEFSDWSVSGGTFGENLTVDGVGESDVCIGDVYRVGTAVLQVSQPRQPCWKLSRKWNIPKLAVLVQKTGRTGWYFRVLETGSINSGDQLELIDRPHPEFTVQRAHKIMHAKPRSAEADLLLSQCLSLSASWREQLERRALRGQSESQSARLFGSAEPNQSS